MRTRTRNDTTVRSAPITAHNQGTHAARIAVLKHTAFIR